MSAEKTEQATEQRKKKSREKGDVVHSRELVSATAMLAGLILLGSAAQRFVLLWRNSYNGTVAASLHSYTTPEEMLGTCGRVLLPAMEPLLLVMAAALAGALATGVAQSGGLQVRVEALAWKPARLNPLSNAKQMFSARSALRLGKSLLPAAAVIAIALHLLRNLMLTMPVMSGARLPETLSGSYQLALDAAWISVGWSGLDYLIEWRSWNQRLKMSKQEIRDESKESNGNPQVKGRIRQIQRAMRKRRVKADLSRATVVITNPTHYAVALEFSFETMVAPKVLCKGRDLHAFEIREEARWAGVPIIENPPLARSLYRTVDEGGSIPFDLYAAVAAILAFLFRQEQQRNAQTGGYGANGYGAVYGNAGYDAHGFHGGAGAARTPHFLLANRIVMDPETLEDQP